MILESHCIPENELADGDCDGAGAGDGGGDDNEDDTVAGPKVLAHVDLAKTICE